MKVITLTCKDLENVGLWNTQWCCLDCHDKGEKDPTEFQVVNVKEALPPPYMTNDCIFGLIGCCMVFEACNYKIPLEDLTESLFRWQLLDAAVEKLLQEA